MFMSTTIYKINNEYNLILCINYNLLISLIELSLYIEDIVDVQLSQYFAGGAIYLARFQIFLMKSDNT